MRTADFLNICAFSSPIASWYQLHTLLPSRSTLHICQKFQWTSEQLKAAYLDWQYFHRRSSKFPVKHFSLLLEWFTPFFNRHYSFYIWDSNFYLSVNIVVLYKFMVTCIQNFTSKVKCEVSQRKKVQDCNYVFGPLMTFQRRKGWICNSRCQVRDRLHVFAEFFCPQTLPWLQFMLSLHFTPSLQSSFCILHPASLYFTLSLQSAFYTDQILVTTL